MSTITLVPASTKQGANPAHAEELYQGVMFRQALRAAETYPDQVYILSPVHGLVLPRKKLQPYQLETSKAIAVVTLARQIQRLKTAGLTTVRCFLPRPMLAVIAPICAAQGIEVVNMFAPCEGRRGIGCHKHVLKQVIDGQNGAGL